MEVPNGFEELRKSEAGLPHRTLVVDATLFGNELRFVNDFRNIAAGPNVEFRARLRKAGEDFTEEIVVGARGGWC